MKRIRLKRCPFCGSKAEYEVEDDNNFHTVITVGCTNGICFCRIVHNLGMQTNDEIVKFKLRDDIEEWNTRWERKRKSED